MDANMSLLPKICEYLNVNNQFSLLKGSDLSSQLCHAWFISQQSDHVEYQVACELLTINKHHPVLEFLDAFVPDAEAELSHYCDELPEGDNPLWQLFSPEAIVLNRHPKR